MKKVKSYEISKHLVKEAWRCVKRNKGSAGIDGESIQDFERNLNDNLYKIWNRMSSGSYFPPPVKVVEITKKTGGKRRLGVPAVSDRVAQAVVKLTFEPLVESHFHEDSYGYRANKSAIQAIDVTRRRCWQYNWVLEFDIKGLFDNIPHDLMMRAVKKHTDCKWILLYIERWLKAPFQKVDGTLIERNQGTPQGGVISPVLSNLFLHYVFDKWMTKYHPEKPFCRYADDGIAHCRTEDDALELRDQLKGRFEECGLELHPEKTKIVYCKDANRKGDYLDTQFDFLGYTFRPRLSKNRSGQYFTSFTPAVSNASLKAMRYKIRKWKMHLKSGSSIEYLSKLYDASIRGWTNYFGNFRKSAMYSILRYINRRLVKWAMRKFKRFKRRPKQAENWLGRISKKEPWLFSHWMLGVKPVAG